MASSSYPSSPEFDPEPVQEPYSFKDATNDEVFEELSSRFILNLPEEEMNSQARLCFQVEQAHWYYEDFVRETNPSFQQLSFKKFLAKLIEYCPVLHQIEDSERAVADFMEYKKQVPVCGAIMLNPPMDKCVLVKGWKASSGWGFPKGKINETEPPHLCAIREVLEETGYNLAGQLDQDTPCLKIILHEQLIRLYVVAGIPEDYPFQTKTRKEISKIDWFKLTDLPTWKRNKQGGSKFYMVTPFIGPLKKTINTLRGNGSQRNMKPQKTSKAQPQASRSEPPANATSQDSTLQASSDNCHGNQVHPPHPQETVEDKTQLNGQLAQLLSGLKLSALSADKGKETEVDAIKANPVADSFAAHLDNSATLPTVSQRSPQPSERPALSPPPTTSAKSQSSPPLLVPTNPTEVQYSQSSTYSTTSSGNIAPASQSARVGVKSPLPPTASPTLSSSRRTSSTADISPYLSRATEVPTSAKILKQISLLETVADESARLAPIIAARAAMASRGAIPSGYPLPTSSVPLPSVPPQLPFANSRDMGHGVLYSSAHPGLPASAAGFHPRIPAENPAFGNTDPFQVRSRTSQAVHRTSMHNPTGSVSLNQNHLLSVINSARAGPVSPVAAQFYPQPLPPHAYPAGPMYHPPALPRAPPLGHTMHGYAPLQPLTIPPYPIADLIMPPNMSTAPNPPNPSSTSLLSVLNARPSQ
ncbi:hypothetical protein NLJ89_g9998 [Agrocybe chaxingu]|uniref:Nudix hydrolase domain-containing protein n=1 Tax=Agrocybe chaxingu TaxID=84603 RepID=A0A9W8MSJ3_9AGAR|nr:hypothetical protein NLJ89_g9998 [Agrocybe chaxingu]